MQFILLSWYQSSWNYRCSNRDRCSHLHPGRWLESCVKLAVEFYLHHYHIGRHNPAGKNRTIFISVGVKSQMFLACQKIELWSSAKRRRWLWHKFTHSIASSTIMRTGRSCIVVSSWRWCELFRGLCVNVPFCVLACYDKQHEISCKIIFHFILVTQMEANFPKWFHQVAQAQVDMSGVSRCRGSSEMVLHPCHPSVQKAQLFLDNSR